MSRKRTRYRPNRNPEQPRPASLDPKPPALLQNIAWFLAHWREHKWPIAIALIVLGVPCVYSLVNWWPKIADASPPTLQNTLKKSTSETSSPALKVRFRDGVAGYVELSFSFALDPAAAPKVYQNYGDQKRAVSDLKEAVEGAAYKSMEGLTLNEARQSRDKIEASIIELTKGAQERTGHTIYQVSIKQIELAHTP